MLLCKESGWVLLTTLFRCAGDEAQARRLEGGKGGFDWGGGGVCVCMEIQIPSCGTSTIPSFA